MFAVTASTTSSFAPCPPGSYPARCCRLIDLGTQTSTFDGQFKTAHKVLLGFEILDAEARRGDGDPYVLSKRYTLSLHEKSALSKDLSTWRGSPIAAGAEFDLSKLVGALALLSVVNVSKGDKTFANIGGIMKAPKGLAASAGSEPLLIWNMAKPDWPVFAQLHPKLQAQIEASPEFAGLKKPSTVALPATPFADMDDDIPF